MRAFLILMAIAGTVLPWIFFAGHFSAFGLSPVAFVREMFNGPAASGATTDLLLSSMVFWVASFVDARARNIAHWWIVLPATLLVGLSLAMPLWLLMRSRKA